MTQQVVSLVMDGISDITSERQNLKEGIAEAGVVRRARENKAHIDITGPIETFLRCIRTV